MIKNYFKIAFRNLWRNKSFSIINISGLAIGMTGAILIGIWVQNELSYDQFHANKNDLYKVWNRTTGPGEVGTWDITAPPVGKALESDFPEVKHSARIYWSIDRLFSIGDKSVKAKGNDVDKPFLTMFSFPLIKGNAAHALDDINSIVITEKFAKRLFNDEDPLNKTIRVDNKENYVVTGVMKDLPSNTEFDFEYLVSLEKNVKFYSDNSWSTGNYDTYVQLQPNVSVVEFNRKIKGEVEHYLPGAGSEIFLHPASKWHLYSRFENGKVAGGRIEIVRLLLLIAGLILLIACINFMNLSTAQSEKRAKEVGVRKVIGAAKSNLISLFLCESIMIALIAGLIAIMVVELSLPAFNNVVEKSLGLDFSNPMLWLFLAGFILLTGLLAGSYPAFYLSSFKPVKMLKRSVKAIKSPLNPRKVLVVLQFSVAIVLVVSTLMIYRQIKFVQSRNTGYNMAQLVEVPAEGDIIKNFDLIKNDLLNSGTVVSMCKNSLGVTVDGSHTSGYQWEGMNKDQEQINFSRVGTDGDFVKTLGLTLLEGRDLDLAAYPSDSAGIMLNETAIRKMGIKAPVGKSIEKNGRRLTIVGVFKDFIIGSPYDNVDAMIVLGTKYWAYNTILKFNPRKDMGKNLQVAESVFKKYNPAYPFIYRFVDQEYEQKFSDQKRTAVLAALFAGLTIFISCLGLFGLAAYMAENRSKEIGIRKVLGASVSGIVKMLSKEFVSLVIVAILIAVPVSWWAMSKWLQDFTWRIDMGWFTFALAGLIAIVIAVLTVSLHAIRAALANPVNSLRSE